MEISNNFLFFANILVAGICTLLCFRMGIITLIGWICSQGILANLFVLKQISLFGMNVTASDVFTISGMFSISLLDEFFGEDYAKKAIWASCISLIFFSIVAQLHLRYIPSEYDFAQPAYKTLFGPNFRIIVASIVAYWVSQQCNIGIFRFLKDRLNVIKLQVRIIIAIAIAQFVDTVLFAFLGLYGIVSGLNEIIIFSFCIKLITLTLLSYSTIFLKKIKTTPDLI